MLLPVLNGMPYLENALSAALRCEDVAQVVVQDAHSADGTRDFLLTIADDRLSVICESDFGQADALNRALVRASEPWILWLNADDIVLPRAVARLADAARSTSTDVIYGDYDLIRPDGSTIRTYRAPARVDPKEVFSRGPGIFSGSMLVQTETLRSIGGFDSTLSHCMDYDLLLRLSVLACSFTYVPGVVASLRMHPGSKSMTYPWGFLRERKLVQRRARSHFTATWRVRAWLGTQHMALLLATTRCRYSRLYSALRRTKQL